MILTLSTLITDFLSEPLENILEQISFMFLGSLFFPPLLLLHLLISPDKSEKVGATPADFFYAFLWLVAITLIITATVMVTMLLANLGPVAPTAITIFFAADFACYKGYKTYKAYQSSSSKPENRLPTSATVSKTPSSDLGAVKRINDTRTPDNSSSDPRQNTSTTKTGLHTNR